MAARKAGGKRGGAWGGTLAAGRGAFLIAGYLRLARRRRLGPRRGARAHTGRCARRRQDPRGRAGRRTALARRDRPAGVPRPCGAARLPAHAAPWLAVARGEASLLPGT